MSEMGPPLIHPFQALQIEDELIAFTAQQSFRG
jgi:hypothetical protein